MGRRSKKKQTICLANRAKTHVMGACGSDIICRCCGYSGPAGLIESNILGTGVLERCPLCRSLNFCRCGEADCVDARVVQLSFVMV